MASSFSTGSSVLSCWISCITTWPSGWRLAIASIGLAATIDPEIPDQELDTRESTGVVYWEGASSVRGSLAGRPIAGQAYVELTGYAR